MSANPRPCKDCQSPTRLTPHPGPRCYTCHKAERKRVKAANHARHVEGTYGLASGEYDELYIFQGGKCAICKKATGKTRRLSVDHDHATGYVRGLICRPCNTLLGRVADDPVFFRQAITYLETPPAQQYLGLRKGADAVQPSAARPEG